MKNFGQSLSKIVKHCADLGMIFKSEVQCGDELVIRTRNSRYTLEALPNGRFRISGGWFDRHCDSPPELTINGCTWGGSIIKQDIVAAIGLCIEFGNRVVTSPVQRVVHLPSTMRN